ncbi:hypothetical protein ACLOJK_034316 [Asimina triloba]
MITSEDLTFIRSSDQIPDNIELLAPEKGETLRYHHACSICSDEYMFKVGVHIPFELSIMELLYIFNAAPIHVAPNSWEDRLGGCMALRVEKKLMQVHMTFTGKQYNKIVSNLLNLVLELKTRWYTSKEVFFQWCQTLTFIGTLTASTRLGATVGQQDEALSYFEGAGPSVEELLALVPYQSEEQAHQERRLKKKRRLTKALSRKDACRSGVVILSLETPVEPVQVLSLEGDASGIGEEAFWGHGLKPQRRAEAATTLTPMLCGIFRARPLDKEGCGSAKRILLKFLLDVWWKFMNLEERIHLIDGCGSQAKYRYHVLKEFPLTILGHHRANDLLGVSLIMDREGHQMVIVVGKRPKEVMVIQATKEVMLLDTTLLSTQTYLEGSFVTIMFEACCMVEEELGARPKRH